jgi:hypothetical protein
VLTSFSPFLLFSLLLGRLSDALHLGQMFELDLSSAFEALAAALLGQCKFR